MQNIKYLTFAANNYIQILLILILSLSILTPLYAADDDEVVDESNYYEISPPFVVNLKTDERRMRFLQVRIQVLGTQSAIDEVTKHNAPIRDAVITALSSQSRETINTPKKKKELQVKIQKEVEKILEELTGDPQIEGLYFTNFVIQ